MIDRVRKLNAMALNCPYCDEPAFPMPYSKRVTMDGTAIFTQRECIMGHTFWSEERVTQSQEELENRIKSYKRKKWNEYMKAYRATPEYKQKKLAQQYHREKQAEEMDAKRVKIDKNKRKSGSKQRDISIIRNAIEKYDEGDLGEESLQ